MSELIWVLWLMGWPLAQSASWSLNTKAFNLTRTPLGFAGNEIMSTVIWAFVAWKLWP